MASFSYWNNYKIQNPAKAAEIESLGLNFSFLPDKEVKEKIDDIWRRLIYIQSCLRLSKQ